MSRLEQLRKLVQLAPDDPLSHYGLGLEYLNLQQWDDADRAFQQTLVVDPRYSAAHYHRARAQIGAGRLDDARRTLQAGMQCAREAGDRHAEGEMSELLATLE
jgi:tetratricopeptide (TPR) repeat protein